MLMTRPLPLSRQLAPRGKLEIFKPVAISGDDPGLFPRRQSSLGKTSGTMDQDQSHLSSTVGSEDRFVDPLR
jgi:hypothetical protein